MFRILFFIKHHFEFLWCVSEYLNGLLVGCFFQKKIILTADKVLKEISSCERKFRVLKTEDLPEAHAFFDRQPEEAYRYFRPHAFDENTLKRLLVNPSFLMMGVFEEERMIGYFFLRLFFNKHSFTGYLVDCEYQGRGIAKKMGCAMFDIAWSNGFRTFATVSRDNVRALAAYRAINDFKIVKELPDNYIYIEYLQDRVK